MRHPAAGGKSLRRSAVLTNRTKGHGFKRTVHGAGNLVPSVKGCFTHRGGLAHTGQGNTALNCKNYVCQGYVVRGAGQHMATGNTAHAFHNALGLKHAHDLLNKLFRNTRADRKLGCRGGNIVILFRKAQQQVQSMAGHCRNTHIHSLFCRRQ